MSASDLRESALSVVFVLAAAFATVTAARGVAFAAPESAAEPAVAPTNGGATATGAANSTAPRVLSPYEQGSLRTGLTRLKTEVEPNPEGKRVESVEVVVLDVFEPRDPAPAFLNWFHANTRDDVVRREVLLHPGQRYSALLAAESERNLRRFIQYSVVLVTPVKGSTPDSVRILVVTKDVWSLRLSWDPAFYQGRLNSLVLSPAELNLMGSTQVVSGNITTTPNNVWLGVTYYVPRVGGSRISSSISANAQLNCRTGDLEGGSGTFSYGKPLFSTRTAWAWGVSATYNNQVVRPYADATASICSAPGPLGVSVALDPNLPSGVAPTQVAYVPNVYRNESLTSQIGFTRSFFVKDKINVSFGLESLRARNAPLGRPSDVYTGEASFSLGDPGLACWPPTADCEGIGPVPAQQNTELDRDRLQWLFEQQRLPASGFRVGPYAQLSAYKTSFVRLLNVNTLGLQEDVQLGHNVSLKIYPAVRPLASRNLLGTIASADYTLPISGGFARLGATSTIEVSGEDDELAKVGVARSTNASARLEFRWYLATPTIGFGRFVMGTSFADQPQWRYAPLQYSLGSTDRLRGYPPNAFVGRALFVNNLEFRTRPIEVLSASLGFVAFWDLGMAARGYRSLFEARAERIYPAGYEVKLRDRIAELRVANGVGAGVRVLLPQIDRQVFRVDLGFPMVETGLTNFTVTAGFHQVFGDN